LRIVLLRTGSGYGALDVFLDGLADALERRGFEPVIVDVSVQSDQGASLGRIAAEGPVAFGFSFGLFGEFRDGEGRSVGDLLGAPHVIQYLDYPLTHALRLDRTPRSVAILVVDESHIDAIEATYGAEHFAFVGFSPHAAMSEAAPPEPPAQFAARPIPVLFSGTHYKPGAPTWTTFEPKLRKLFDQAFDLALSREWMPAMDVLRSVLTAQGLNPEAANLRDVRRAATFLHEQVRSHRRFQLLKATAKAGLPLHVYGKGYERDLYRFKNVIFGGEAEFREILGLMRCARMVLNVNANFGAGSHERPLSAMLAGAVAASDHSRFYEERFREAEEIVLYRWMSLDDDMARLTRLAADPHDAHAIARAGQARAVADHRWDNRVDTILAAAQAVRTRADRAG
jgi:spore maturation protein CgeB